MHNSDSVSWLGRLLGPANGIVLWIFLALLLFALAYWAHERGAQARARADRARRDAQRNDLGGDSYFLPLPAIEQAVEIANPVEIDSLLSGEPETVAARARALLTAPTGVSIDGIGELSFALPSAPNPPRVPPAPVSIPPTIAIALPKAAAPAPRVPASAPPPKPFPPSANALPPVDKKERIPVRDLVLTWFEARGYRARAIADRTGPIELELRHRSDDGRAYAFVVERERVTGVRAAALLKLARAAGHSRVLIAAENGCDEKQTRELRRLGIRIYDEASIRAEVDKVDIRIAAKIIAVARGRGVTRRSAHAAGADPAPGRARTSVGTP